MLLSEFIGCGGHDREMFYNAVLIIGVKRFISRQGKRLSWDHEFEPPVGIGHNSGVGKLWVIVQIATGIIGSKLQLNIHSCKRHATIVHNTPIHLHIIT